MEKPSAITDSTHSAISTASSDAPVDGEIKILMEEVEWENICNEEDEEAAHPKRISVVPVKDDNGLSSYGKPLSVEEAAELMPPGDNGLVWNATIIPDELFDTVRNLRKGISPGDFDHEDMVLKARRPCLPVRASNFFSSLTKVGPRYIFSGVLNGWPGLTCFELLGLEQKGQITGRWTKVWRVKEEGSKGVEPKLPTTKHFYRAVLRGAPWTGEGWSKESPGFAFWYEARLIKGPRMSYGRDMVKNVEDAKCTYIHMVNHRYAVKRESPRDLITYHSICLLEWDHGQYMTVIEAAFLNGIGGYKGKCNWYHDKDEPVTKLFQMLPPEMILPWRTSSAEIRVYDVEARTLPEFEVFLDKYKGNLQRFIDPRTSLSLPARLSFRSKKHIAQYLINYISRDSSYADLRRNCQTFAADMCSFIAGKKDIAPFRKLQSRNSTNHCLNLASNHASLYISQTLSVALNTRTAPICSCTIVTCTKRNKSSGVNHFRLVIKSMKIFDVALDYPSRVLNRTYLHRHWSRLPRYHFPRYCSQNHLHRYYCCFQNRRLDPSLHHLPWNPSRGSPPEPHSYHTPKRLAPLPNDRIPFLPTDLRPPFLLLSSAAPSVLDLRHLRLLPRRPLPAS
jgi:hypothetical protein